MWDQGGKDWWQGSWEPSSWGPSSWGPSSWGPSSWEVQQKETEQALAQAAAAEAAAEAAAKAAEEMETTLGMYNDWEEHDAQRQQIKDELQQSNKLQQFVWQQIAKDVAWRRCIGSQPTTVTRADVSFSWSTLEWEPAGLSQALAALPAASATASGTNAQAEGGRDAAS